MRLLYFLKHPAGAMKGLIICGSREYLSEVHCGRVVGWPSRSHGVPANGVRPPLHKLCSEVDIACNVSS